MDEDFNVYCTAPQGFDFIINQLVASKWFIAPFKVVEEEIYNMTWDLYILNHYMQLLKEKENNKEYMFATDDKLLRNLANIILDINLNQDIDRIKKYIGNKDCEMLDYYNKAIKRTDSRNFMGKKFKNVDQRTELIRKLEKELYTN